MMKKDLKWSLPTPPTDVGIAQLIDKQVITPEEGRNILFNKGKSITGSGKTTVVHLLLDTSGSMSSVQDATIDGYNEYVNSLKADGGKFKVSLTLFDSDEYGKLRLEKRHEAVNIDDVPELNRETYQPRGGTPLYDAFCTTLNNVIDRKDEKHLFVVLTDGEENMSREYNAENMRKAKKLREDKGNWTFVYIGANQDAWANAKNWGYSASNVSNFNATSRGTGAVFDTLRAATVSYSSSADMNTHSFYTKDQQKKNEQTK